MLHLYLSSTVIFMLTALLNLLTTCFPPPAASLHKTFNFCSSLFCPNARVNQYLHSFIPYTGKLWNSPLFVFPPAYDLNSFIVNWTALPCLYFSFTGSGDKRDFFFLYFIYFSLSQYPFNVKKKR